MDFETLQSLDRDYIMPTYGRFPVDIDHGHSATLYSLAGKKYIDFTSGIGVNSIGYTNEKWIRAVTEQAGKLAHISNLFYSQPCAELAQAICKRSGMADVFFANSGAEANEGLIKLARKYSFDKYGKGRGTVITLKNSFHGRTMNTLTATGQDVFHNFFFPFPEGFRYAEPTLEGVEAVAGHDVCAVMLELDRHRPHRYLLCLSAVRHPAGCRLLRQGHRRRPAAGRLFGFGEVPRRHDRRHPRQHLRRQPHLLRRRTCRYGHADRRPSA